MASAFNDRVAAAIRRALAQEGRSQGDLAQALGWSDPYLSRRLTGRVSFSLTDIELIATALDVPRSQLLEAPMPRAASARKAG
jgi:transcriptional regulator with XRE-family HTH domain